MAEFDPDAYLATGDRAAGFDPDAYLAAEKPAGDDASTKIRKFFDPDYGKPSGGLATVGRQVLKAGSLMVPASIPGAAAGGAMYAASDKDATPGDVAIGAAAGAGVGTAFKVGGAGLKWLGDKFGQKAAAAHGERVAQGAAAKEAEVRSLEAAARERSANAYRQVQRMEELLANGALGPEERAALESFKATPEYATLIKANATGSLVQAPEALAEREAAGAAAREAREGLPAAIEEIDKSSPVPEAARKVGDRLKRYWPVLAGGIAGHALGGAVGAGAGAAVGTTGRWMVRSFGRLAKDPAFRESVYTPIARVADALVEKGAPPVAGPVSDAASGAIAERFRLAPASADDSPESKPGFVEWLRRQGGAR